MVSVFQRATFVSTTAPAVADPSQLITRDNLQGQTDHFAVYLDPALGGDGAADAQGVLSQCEADYATVSGYFGGLAAGPFRVILLANPNGAYHFGCASTDLFCDGVTSPSNPDLSEFLNVAEFVEVFEAVQAAGWDCGKSNGEGLSRVLASDAYPAQVRGFATAAAWLDSPRHDFVDHTLDSDTDPAANGCSVLFLNWLRFQLNSSWQQVVGAAAPTLGETYTKLTGKRDGFKTFSALLEGRFPKGKPSGFAGDNPFPI